MWTACWCLLTCMIFACRWSTAYVERVAWYCCGAYIHHVISLSYIWSCLTSACEMFDCNIWGINDHVLIKFETLVWHSKILTASVKIVDWHVKNLHAGLKHLTESRQYSSFNGKKSWLYHQVIRLPSSTFFDWHQQKTWFPTSNLGWPGPLMCCKIGRHGIVENHTPTSLLLPSMAISHFKTVNTTCNLCITIIIDELVG